MGKVTAYPIFEPTLNGSLLIKVSYRYSDNPRPQDSKKQTDANFRAPTSRDLASGSLGLVGDPTRNGVEYAR